MNKNPHLAMPSQQALSGAQTSQEKGAHAPSSELLRAIFEIVARRGIKATTMDHVAAELSMSKRTLYEIFESKKGMAIALLSHYMEGVKKENTRILREAPNVMVAIFRIFLNHRDQMNSLSKDFFLDMEEYYPDLHERYRDNQREMHDGLTCLYRQGVAEGVLRPDVNFPLSCMLVKVQMEGLRRIEEFFADDFSLLEAYDAICLGFMRSVVSPEGMKILDELTPGFSPHLFSASTPTRSKNNNKYNNK